MLSPQDVFSVESILDLFFTEGTITVCTFALSLRDIPVTKEAPRRTVFYVRSPGSLEPRRPPPPPPSLPHLPPPPPPPSPLPPLRIAPKHPPVTKIPDRIILVQESLDDMDPEVFHPPVTKIPDRIILVQESLDDIHPEVSQEQPGRVHPEVSQERHERDHQEDRIERNVIVH